MSLKILVRQVGGQHYQWLHGGHAGGVAQTGTLSELKQVCEDGSQLVLLATAEYCTLKHCHYDDGEQKLLRQIVPYQLEEDLLADVEELHFAIGECEQNQVAVAIIKRDLLTQWLADFSAHGLEIHRILPEVAMLPWLENQWTLLVDNQRWLLRSGDCAGFAMEPELAVLALALLVEEQGVPGSLVLYCQEPDRDGVKSLLPEPLRHTVLWQQGSYWSVIAGVKLEQEPLNLLQGDFVRSLPWKKWWSAWRVAAILLAVAIGLKLTVNIVEQQTLETRNVQLRAEIEQAYRSAIPKGALMNAEKQLRRKVEAMKGGNSQSFVALLEKVSAVMATVEGINLQSVNYTEQRSEFRLTLVANSFDDIEKLRRGLEQKGLKAELTGSSAEGSKTRARLRIRG